MNCYFSFCRFADELVVGIATGLYTGGVVTQLVRFGSLKNEALRLVREIDSGNELPWATTIRQIREAHRRFTNISSDFYYLRHERAGDNINKLSNELAAFSLHIPSAQAVSDAYPRWQRELRKMPLNWLRVLLPVLNLLKM
jgi:hypothetical protein